MTTHDFPAWFVPSHFLLRTFGLYLGLKDPFLQLLALYLVSSPLLDTRGEYDLPQAALQEHLEMEIDLIKSLLTQLSDIGFCRYDWEAERVQVPLVAQIYERLFSLSSEREGVSS